MENTNNMEKIGRIKYTSKGVYSPDVTYTPMNIVLYGGSLWECLKETTGNAPPDHQYEKDGNAAKNEFWQLFLPGALGDDYIKKTDIAKAPTETEPGKAGIWYPDGKTILIDENGMASGGAMGVSGTQEEINEKLAAGELADGTILYIKDVEIPDEPDEPSEPEINIEVDEELGMTSNPVQNQAITQEFEKVVYKSDIDSLEQTEVISMSDQIVVRQNEVEKFATIQVIKDCAKIWAGKNLGNGVTSKQWDEIDNGTFCGISVCDYWEIGGRKWRFAHPSYWLNTGDVNCTINHAAIVPDTYLYTGKMNETNTTEGGYVGSKMRQEGLNQAKAIINEAFGAEHILQHREMLVNAVTSGKSTGHAWYDSDIELMNEIMVFGSSIFVPACDGTKALSLVTTDKTQLAQFAINPNLICNRESYWLRDVVTASYFSLSHSDGVSSCVQASRAYGVRPIFGICKSQSQ